MGLLKLVGKILGQYELTEFLGKGGMGVVYRAHQAKLGRDVAVKILAQAADPRHVKRFHREAETAALLEHPHIVPIYDYGTQDGMNYVAMRLLTGGSLAEKMGEWIAGREEYPTYRQIASLLKPISSALDYAHSNGIVHRDIKPSNVMFDAYGHAFLVDFGLVKLMDSSKSALTGSGMILGTPAFMAPEQWQDEQLTPAIDQYALAVIIYAMVTGSLPFDSDSPYDLMRLHCYEQPIPAYRHKRDFPASASNVLNKALAKKATHRFPTVTDFAIAFEDALNAPTNIMVGAAELDSQMKTMRPESMALPTLPKGTLYVERSRDLDTVGLRVTIDRFPFQIGRLNRNLNFDADRNVSRNHAHITQNEHGEFFVEDQDSTLKTAVNDREIPPYTRTKIEHNDTICLGTTTVLKFTINGSS